MVRRALVEGVALRGPEMAHNKIPPRWLNCPRRGQPVAGNPDGGVLESLLTGGSRGGRSEGRSFRRLRAR